MRKVYALLLLLASATVHAQESRLEFGFGVGRGDVDYAPFLEKQHPTTLNLFGGWRFNRYAALEFDYYDGIDASGPVIGAPSVRLKVKNRALAASLLTSLPLGETFSLIARAGYARWAQSATASGAVALAGTEIGSDMLYGAGVGLRFDGALLRLEYGKLDVADADVSLINLAVVWDL